MIMACLQIYRELLSLTTFLRVHSNSEVSYLSYPNSKTTCQIKLKFFLWTKLLENLLLPKYLISVTAPLINYFMMNHFCGMFDQPNALSLISGWERCQRSSPSLISNTPRTGFEPAQTLNLGYFVEWIM